jgi:hypothetical protein
VRYGGAGRGGEPEENIYHSGCGGGGGLEEEEGESLEGEVDEGAAGVGEEAPEVGAHHALPPDAVPLVELLRATNQGDNQNKILFHFTNHLKIATRCQERREKRACRLDVAGDGAAVGDVEEVERAGGRRGRRRLHPRRHVRVLHLRLSLQHPPPPSRPGCRSTLPLSRSSTTPRDPAAGWANDGFDSVGAATAGRINGGRRRGKEES